MLLVFGLLLFQAQGDARLASRIRELIDIYVAADSNVQENAVAAEAQEIFDRAGLPSIAAVGDEASYEFVWLTCSTGTIASQERVLRAARREAKRHKIPEDALTCCAAHVRLEKTKTGVAKRPPKQPVLRDQIEQLIKTDQEVRQKKDFDLEKMAQVDRDHKEALELIFATYGVPTYRMVGPRAASDFVVMVQHQSAELRKKVLPKLKTNVDTGQADPGSYAMVVDRTRTEAGEKQLYGENLVCDAANPKLHPTSIEEEAGVDQRRAMIGLMRLRLYVEVAVENSPGICGAK